MHDRNARRRWRTPLTAAALAASVLAAPVGASAAPVKPTTKPACKAGEIKKTEKKVKGVTVVRTWVCDKEGNWVEVAALAPGLESLVDTGEATATRAQKPTGGGKKVTCEVAPGINADVGETMTITLYTKDASGKVVSIDKVTFRCGADGEWHTALTAKPPVVAAPEVTISTGAKS